MKHEFGPLHLFVHTSHLWQQRVIDSIVEDGIDLFGTFFDELVEFLLEREVGGHLKSTTLSKCIGRSLETSSARCSYHYEDRVLSEMTKEDTVGGLKAQKMGRVEHEDAGVAHGEIPFTPT